MRCGKRLRIARDRSGSCSDFHQPSVVGAEAPPGRARAPGGEEQAGPKPTDEERANERRKSLRCREGMENAARGRPSHRPAPHTAAPRWPSDQSARHVRVLLSAHCILTLRKEFAELVVSALVHAGSRLPAVLARGEEGGRDGDVDDVGTEIKGRQIFSCS